ncbi:MAG: AIPR family protein [Alcanivoracaceae bacterium]|nr:AIPR family protein [Alcanivoracaceae bacterium]
MAKIGVQPLELMQLCELLHSKFDGLIEGTGSGDTAKERNFFSKALAAYYLVSEVGASLEDAVTASIDGGDDHGVDSVYVDATETIWLIQSKYIDRGVGEPALGDVNKFENGIRDLLRKQYDRFNQHLQAKIPLIDRALDSGVCQVKAVLVYTGSALSDDRRRMMGDLVSAFTSPARTNFLRFVNAGLESFHQYHLSERLAAPISLDIELEQFGFLSEPYPCYYGGLDADQIKAFKTLHGDHLFNANIRQFKGNTAVNIDIVSTLTNTPENFFYFNNGVTLLCDEIQQISAHDETNRLGKFRLRGVSVINGAQTVSCIADAIGEDENQSTAKVMATIISLENAPDRFGESVTQFRNNQNAVSDVDFAALDENQQQWAKTLANSGINYRYKGGLQDDETFNLEFAARALACSYSTDESLHLVALAKKDSKKLFSRAKTAENESTYKSIFPDTLEARVLWRAVQICQEVISVITREVKNAQGTDKEIISHSRWMVCYLVMCRKFGLKLEQEVALTLVQKNLVGIEAQNIIQRVITEFNKKAFDKSPKSVFENQNDLQTLKGPVMAALANT